jgi:capsular exopolysaccharide synthesis family protein
MGRIDEALRRAGRNPRDLDLPHAGAAGPFLSPWSVADVEFHNERPTPIAVSKWVASPARSEITSAVDLFRPGWRERLAIGSGGNPILADQFRRLAATLLHAQRREQFRTVMVTSALAEDGKTLTAVNLALVLSESYSRRVLLVEGDFRRPAITRAANIPAGPGLSEALKAGDECKPTLIQLTETLTLLPAGSPDSEPLSALISSRLQALLQDACEKFDWVILDTPPLAATTDATLLCPLVDAVLLVIRANRTPLESVKQAVDALGRERILGVVLNASEQSRTPQTEYYTDGAANGNP